MKNSAIDLGSATMLLRKSCGVAEGNKDAFSIVRRLKAPIWIFDIDNSCIVFANAPACQLWQADTEEALLARDFTEDMSATVGKRLRQYQVDFVERDASFNEMWTLYPNGVPKSVMVIFSSFLLDDGRMGMQCEVVAQPDDAPENLRSAEALLHTDVMITLFSMQGPVLYMNPAARNAAALSQQSLSELFLDSQDHETFLRELDSGNEYRMVTRVITVQGARWYDLSAKRCSDAVTGEPAILVTAIDVSELKVARDKARYLADRDQLTGCYNRSFLQQHMAMLSKQETKRCAIIYFDVDKFKQINDRLGHEMGDRVLRELATRAREFIRKDDLVVRLGGDEFVVLLKDIPADRDFSPQVGRLLQAFAAPIVHDSIRLNVTVSMGVTTFEPQSADCDDVLRDADIALYVSKQAGRNCFTFFDEEIGNAVRERDQIEAAIKRAIKNQEFVLYYQPRGDLATKKIVSVEALVRWENPQHGIIMPDKFIPICEETGMIEELGQQILDMGCRQAIAWVEEGIDIEMSINISPRQFQDKMLMDTLRMYSEMPGFPKQKIELEITENVLVGNHDLIARKLETIVKLGYRIAIDDFGTGYSNLTYISRFPLDCIKIDRSFIHQLPKSGPIIKLILTLAEQVGATTVAEGVENEEEYEWLVKAGCNQVQGYYISRPVTVDQLKLPILETAG